MQAREFQIRCDQLRASYEDRRQLFGAARNLMICVPVQISGARHWGKVGSDCANMSNALPPFGRYVT
jgi:hypothetical protein